MRSRISNSSVLVYLILLSGFAHLVTVVKGHAAEWALPLNLQETSVLLRQVDLDRALRKDAMGYPRMDSSLVDLTRIVDRPHAAVVLENRYIRVVLLPAMGRVFSLFDKLSGHEQLWTNQIARPLFNQQNELGWWMVWGGVEYTIPAGEHGTTWALPWQSEIAENSVDRKAVRMRVLEPKTKLEQTVEISIRPDTAAFEAEISIRNTSMESLRFSHWVNPMWAPGGRGELTPRTEFIVPTEQMIVADRDFNRWMLGERIQPWRANPLRMAENWSSIGDLLAAELTDDFYSAFSHEANEGVARVFDHRANPGMDIWTWGFPPPPERQKEYSLRPNLGYVEMWGGTVRDFSDEALKPIAPGETVRFVEWMYPYRKTSGLTRATRDMALNFTFTNPSEEEVNLAICAARRMTNLTLNVLYPSGMSIWTTNLTLTPEFVVEKTLRIPKTKNAAKVELTARRGGETILRAIAEPSPAIRWGAPYMPRPSNNK